jgi:hypothetical protein
MSKNSASRSLIIFISVALFILISTYLISLFARGYRFSPKNGLTLTSTGIISTVSKPKGASVYIDDKLITATDDTINLSPGIYKLKISKDGFLPWEKTITVKPETVYQADVQLFSSVPDLKPITLTGAINPSINGDNSKIVYAVASASATKDNGLYLLESYALPLSLLRSDSQQLTSNTATINWANFTYTFSPNSRQILATNSKTKVNYLISLDTPISSQKLTDVTDKLENIYTEWQTQTSLIINSKLNKIPKEIQSLIATDSAQYIQFSSDDNKILYLAQKNGEITPNLITPPPAQSTQPQQRQIQNNNYYVYDIKDDTNFLIDSKDNLTKISWLPNSTILVFIQDQDLKVIDYDGTNKQSIFSKNFDTNCAAPWSDGSKIIILTNAYFSAPKNLYAISVR